MKKLLFILLVSLNSIASPSDQPNPTITLYPTNTIIFKMDGGEGSKAGEVFEEMEAVSAVSREKVEKLYIVEYRKELPTHTCVKYEAEYSNGQKVQGVLKYSCRFEIKNH